jgi:murein L,D-transpeptidase YcbB/YkuD
MAHSGPDQCYGGVAKMTILRLGAVLACLLAPRDGWASANSLALTAAPAPAVEAALAAASKSVDSERLRAVYEPRRFAPLWVTGSVEAERQIRAVSSVLSDAGREGLDPASYHADEIAGLLNRSDADDLVRLELLLSDGVLRYAYHQTRGVSRPGRNDPEARAVDQPPFDAVQTITEILDAPDAGAALRALAPPQDAYARLRDALAAYRQLQAAGSWPTVSDGPTLREGMSDTTVPAVRRRLAATGEGPPTHLQSKSYDHELAAAVKRFQQRNGLEADGVLGKATRAALNISASQRIDQIIVNMERWRWAAPTFGDRYVKVNVPAFSLVLVEKDVAVLSMPVVVGKMKDPTPTFSSTIETLVFNPSWYVPPRIAREEIFPKADRDESYLDREGYVTRRVQVRAGGGGDGRAGEVREVTRLRQVPGPQNPLGRVKFNIPNVFGVYLHDTPSRHTFARTARAFSHGCIRLGKAMDLADALMGNTDGWETQRKRLLSTWDTRTISLATPVPVHIVYETAWSDAAGVVHFHPDIYNRDDGLRRQMASRPGARSVAAQLPPAASPVAAP